MKNFFTNRMAANAILFILSVIVVFHILVMAGIIPFEIVWGGRLKDQNQMLMFETVSITLNLLMLTVVAIKARLLKVKIKPGFINILLWLMAFLFTLNTIGNLLSNNELEKLIFTPLTFLLAVLCFRLAISKDQKLESTLTN